MKQIALSLIFLLSAQCASLPEAYDSGPRRDTGCQGLTGARRLECLQKSVAIWQERERATGKDQVLDSQRQGETRVDRVETCWSDFCRVSYHSYYAPEFWSSVGRYALVAGIGLVLGGALGYAVAKPAVAALFAL